MDDLLKPVKTVRNVKSNIEKFETLSLREQQSKNDLTSTRKILSEISSGSGAPLNVLGESAEEEGSGVADDHVTKDLIPSEDRQSPERDSLQRIDGSISSPEHAFEILKQQPTEESFAAVMQYLEDGIHKKHHFSLHVPSASSAQILNVLVANVVADRWPILKSNTASKVDKSIRKSLLLCMSSVVGIGAVIARIQSLLTSPQISKAGFSQRIVFGETVSFFGSIAFHKNLVRDLLERTQSSVGRPGQEQVLWTEATSLLAGSKILNVFLEASTTSELKGEIPSWLQDPKEYCGWLGVNIAYAAISLTSVTEDAWKMLANLLKRALSLSHKDAVVAELYMQLLLGEKALWTPLRLLCGYLPRLNQKTVLEIMLQDMSQKFLSTSRDKEDGAKLVINGRDAVGGVASIISGFISDNEYLEAQLIDWLTNTSSAHTLETRRAMILVLSSKEGKLPILLEKSMKIFSDKLHIKHDSILQQEALAQVVLVTAGYLHRMKSQSMFELSKSSSYLQAVSNRLAASLPQARFLGMVVGMAISRLVDQPDKTMNFDVEEMQSQEAKWWFSLVSVEDAMGAVEVLRTLSTNTRRATSQLIPQKRNAAQTPQRKRRAQAETSKIISIEEVDDDDSESEDDDLIPYQKPDEDPEDSDEDPTLINRSKPKAPVYVHDLVKSLNVVDKPEVVEMALKTAPSLIRRKAHFGSELSENIIDLASTLINLQDGMSNLELQELRLQSLIACLVSQPSRMGPWFANMYFTGDFSLSQRATILTTIGLSSREIAGHKDEGTPSASQPVSPLPPSKQLPPHLAAVYQAQPQSQSPSQPQFSPMHLATLTNTIQHTTLRPMTLAAADAATGPNILKIRTFSSRMAVQERSKARTLERSRVIPKDVHKLLAQDMYLPLCCRLSILVSGGAGVSVKTNTLLEPQMLKLFLQTLTVVLTTLGPAAVVQLPAVNQETLLLLMALQRRGELCMDAAVLPAMLTLLLVLLDVSVEAGGGVEEGLVRDHGDGFAELVRWLAQLADGQAAARVPDEAPAKKVKKDRHDDDDDDDDDGSDAADAMPWTVVAAGIQVKWFEVASKFQARMMGLVAGLGGDGF
ncbi:hypothetical protein GJ744_005729 [Endocarpon pusillum]|uniref:Telomere length regulation protein conserved domain-containing protein n=1 Tax=Endocarpon pusillum TaxID=364733 RepID=A0A8H7AMI7_9EURO|nr:hypothetical protein GJ744_005729 [Endocarpon pusillum]